MSRGLGRFKRKCLRVIELYEAAGKRPTTFNIAANVYSVERDPDVSRLISDAQLAAIKRALFSLRRAGFVSRQDRTIRQDGGWYLSQVGSDGQRAERYCLWSTVRGDANRMTQR